MTAATRKRTAQPPAEPVLPTHAQGLALFEQVLADLEAAGWYRARVDTFYHPANATQNRSAFTVRHHYDHGSWELYYEPDRYWNRNGVPSKTRTARIRLDRPLPQDGSAQVINDLFGPEAGRYFPATAEDAKPRKAVKIPPTRSR